MRGSFLKFTVGTGLYLQRALNMRSEHFEPPIHTHLMKAFGRSRFASYAALPPGCGALPSSEVVQPGGLRKGAAA